MYLQLLMLVTVTLVCAQEDLKYTVFVVDDTGSMHNEIKAVKKWLKNCMDGLYPNCLSDRYILVSFNDPHVGNVTMGPTSNISEVLSAIESLDTRGGDDCPELRFRGMQLALDLVPQVDESVGREKGLKSTRCKVFLITDATAKDNELRLGVEMSFVEKGCSLFPILTGCCGDCPNACDSVSEEYCIDHVFDVVRESVEEPKKRKKRETLQRDVDAEYLYKLAERTGGSILIMDIVKAGLKHIDVFVNLEEKVSFGFCQTSKIAGPIPRGFKCQNECESNGMCWDKSVGQCFCNNASDCPSQNLKKATCPEKPKVHKCRKDIPYEFVRSAKSCRKFNVCVFGTKYRFICPEDKVFDGEVCNDKRYVKRPCGYDRS